MIVKLRVLLLHDSELNDELLRPSSHVNICLAETMGTPLAWAEVTTASATSELVASVWALTLKTP